MHDNYTFYQGKNKVQILKPDITVSRSHAKCEPSKECEIRWSRSMIHLHVMGSLIFLYPTKLTFFWSFSKILYASNWLSYWCPSHSHQFCHINAFIISIYVGIRYCLVQVGIIRQPTWLCASLHIMEMFICKISYKYMEYKLNPLNWLVY